MRLPSSAVLLLLISSLVWSQTPAEIAGTWAGASLCVDKAVDRNCKDEVVVYRVRPDSVAPDRVVVDAWKIVGRDTLHMGTLTFVPSTLPHSWECELRTPRYHGVWSYTVSGHALAGTLVDLPSKRLVRRVVAERVNP